jgi:hypothetical protein
MLSPLMMYNPSTFCTTPVERERERGREGEKRRRNIECVREAKLERHHQLYSHRTNTSYTHVQYELDKNSKTKTKQKREQQK